PSGIQRILVNMGRQGPVRRHAAGEALGLDAEPYLDPRDGAALRALGNGYAIEVPITLKGRDWGTMWAARQAGQEPFDRADRDLARALARQVAASVEQAESFAKVTRLAYTDALTGLANRRAVDEVLESAMMRYRINGAPVSLVACDVNGLKRVNDEQGHDAGDALLVDVASALKVASSAFHHCLAARVGGDEFCVVLDGHGLSTAVAVARHICTLTAHLTGEAQVSCGVAATDGILPAETSSALVRLADEAQYRAKRNRATRPVVAGRDPLPMNPRPAKVVAPPPPPAPMAVVDDRPAAVTGGEPDRGWLLDAGLRVLDQLYGAPARARLEAVAECLTVLLGAAGWWVWHAPVGAAMLTAVSTAADRGRWRGRIHPRAAVGSLLELDDYPATAAAVAGGAFAVVTSHSGAAMANEALLTASGYAGLLAGGGTNAEGGWLVEIFTDELGIPIDTLPPTFRALVAVALAS
ncbi:MAG: sensor domain-containing diguanylate cyclase, partial [Actinomycetota bacterium]|nr:sensor domain-containing diguanylate cyclase [Actinomycetota bacterium]